MAITRWNKDQKRLIKILKPFGHTIAKGKTHNKILNKDDKLIGAFAGTPSEGHWLKNTINQLIKDGELPGVKKL
jgi:hypothetical protein